MSKTRPKIEIGTTWPCYRDGRFFNAEVVNCVKIGSRNWWTVRLTEDGQPVRRPDGTTVEWQTDTKSIGDEIVRVESHRQFAPRAGSPYVVRYVLFPAWGLWAEVRSDVQCGGSRPTHWDRCEYETPESLVASGDGIEVHQHQEIQP